MPDSHNRFDARFQRRFDELVHMAWVIAANHGVRGLLHDDHVELLAAREDVGERSH
jgi:hypothetical protein